MTRKRHVTIHLGDLFASREPAVIRTLLGSCVAACLRDPVSGVAGMNHFMLPAPLTRESAGNLPRFGVHAMELLIGEIQKLGGERARLEAKVFGAGHVLDLLKSGNGVGEQNIIFIRTFLEMERIPLLAQDLGGLSARQVLFHTDSGKVLVRRVSGQRLRDSAAELEHQQRAQRELQGYGDITLFDD
jgi:chemotaxis protein CheD